jgi:uncharacterized protein (DUF433 family)
MSKEPDIGRIVRDPRIHHGDPVIVGTRVPAAIMAGQVRGGASEEDVAEAYELTIEDVRAAVAWAAARRK